jgi:hypothetical protein
MCLVTCIQTSNLSVIHTKKSSPCGMYWCVLYRKVLHTTSYYTGWPIAIWPAFKQWSGQRSSPSTCWTHQFSAITSSSLGLWWKKKISHKYLKLALAREMLPWAGHEQWTRPAGRLLLTLANWTRHNKPWPGRNTTKWLWSICSARGVTRIVRSKCGRCEVALRID